MDLHEALRLLCVSLEAHLGAYETECLKSKPRNRGLNQIEEVLKRTFIPAAKPIQGLRFTLHPGVRVNELLRNMDAGDTGEEAVCRYFLRHRYKSNPCDNTVTVGDVSVKLYVGSSRAIGAANEFTQASNEQFKAVKIRLADGYILQNIVTGKFYHAKGELTPEVVSKLMEVPS